LAFSVPTTLSVARRVKRIHPTYLRERLAASSNVLLGFTLLRAAAVAAGCSCMPRVSALQMVPRGRSVR
jgi:hypothetical protein